jgi:hypothetical protein
LHASKIDPYLVSQNICRVKISESHMENSP